MGAHDTASVRKTNPCSVIPAIATLQQNLPNNTIRCLDVSDQLFPHASRRGARKTNRFTSHPLQAEVNTTATPSNTSKHNFHAPMLESTRVYMTPHRCERLIRVLSSWRLPPCRQNLPNNTTTGLNVSDQMVPHASRRRASERLIDLLVILGKQGSTRLPRHPTQATTQRSCPHRHELCQTGETTRAGCSLLGCCVIT